MAETPDQPGGVRVASLESGRVLHLVLDRPKGNVLTRSLMDALRDALRAHAGDRHLALVVLQGAGGHFSFGASVEEHRRDEAPAMLESFHGLVRELAAFPVPVAALVEGRCLGGAFELALCCHLVFATPGAVFGCPEIRLGVFPPVLAAIGHLRLPGALAERLLLTGDTIDGKEAKAAGWVTAELVGDEPLKALLDWQRRNIAMLSAAALRIATRAAREGSGFLAALGEPLSRLERLYVERVLSSRDGNEGIEAFLARRPPRWEDE